MGKVKIFNKENFEDLEFAMNHWITVFEIIIVDIKYSTTFNATKNVINYSAMIIYKTDNDLRTITNL